MIDLARAEDHILCVESFEELVSRSFRGKVNAICWSRNLLGDFSEIVSKVAFNGNMAELDQEELRELDLSDSGNLAREILFNDFELLAGHGASPALNLIKCYDRDDFYPFFPTDVYSFHVDRSPIPTDTFVCTYHGAPSDILPNSQAIQKVLVPEIRSELKKLYDGKDDGFEDFLVENFFDLHYHPKSLATPISLGMGNLWKLAIDHPESKVPPCLHRAPEESDGQTRLMMIC